MHSDRYVRLGDAEIAGDARESALSLLNEMDGFDFELQRIDRDGTGHRDTSSGFPQSSGVHETGQLQ